METFEREPINGMSNWLKQKRLWKKSCKLSPPRKSTALGVEVESVPWTKGGPKLSFLEEYKLDEKSHLADWLNALLPLTPKDNMELLEDVDVKGDWRTKFSVANWTAYTNTKAKIANAGEWGHKFVGQWTDVTNDDVQQFLGFIMMDGLNPSLYMIQNFWLQEQDTVQRNDFIHNNCRQDAAH